MPYLVYFLDGSSIAATATDLDAATGLAIDEAADRHYACLEVERIDLPEAQSLTEEEMSLWQIDALKLGPDSRANGIVDSSAVDHITYTASNCSKNGDDGKSSSDRTQTPEANAHVSCTCTT